MAAFSANSEAYQISERKNLQTLRYWIGCSQRVCFPSGVAIPDLDSVQTETRFKRQRLERTSRKQPDCSGLFRLDISKESVNVFKKISDDILSASHGGTQWSSDLEDGRRRGYGFPPWSGVERLAKHKIKFYMFEFDEPCFKEQAKLDEMRNINASVSLQESNLWTPDIEHATNEIIAKLQPLIDSKYRKYLALDQLIALQPNYQPLTQTDAGKVSHLNLHVDQPRYEGFGVLIVTIAIKGNGTVVLLDEKPEPHVKNRDKDAWSFDLHEAQCYVLSGDARNKCLHGVLPHGERTSLNLRFGLHGSSQDDKEETVSFEAEFDQHWT